MSSKTIRTLPDGRKVKCLVYKPEEFLYANGIDKPLVGDKVKPVTELGKGFENCKVTDVTPMTGSNYITVCHVAHGRCYISDNYDPRNFNLLGRE